MFLQISSSHVIGFYYTISFLFYYKRRTYYVINKISDYSMDSEKESMEIYICMVCISLLVM